jgi:hypothetical protein
MRRIAGRAVLGLLGAMLFQISGESRGTAIL